MEDKIKQDLLNLGFNIDSIGVVYWVDAIRYIQKNPLCWDVFDIYDYLAKKYNIKNTAVERSLRTAINPAKKNIQEKYNYYGKIKNQTFLNLIRLELI